MKSESDKEKEEEPMMLLITKVMKKMTDENEE